MQKSKLSLNTLLLGVFAILAIVMALGHLDTDMSVMRRIGDYGDEGYWIQNAFNKIKHNQYLTDDQAQGYYGAPLFTYLLGAFAGIFGATLKTARLFSFVFALLSSGLVFLIVKKITQHWEIALVIWTLFLSLPELVFYGVWCTPITMEWFFLLLYIYWTLNHKLVDIKSIVIGALLIVLNVLSKTTSIYLIGVFAVQIAIDAGFFNSNSKKFKPLLLASISAVAVFLAYFVVQTIMKASYPAEYSQFKQLIKWNINLKQGLIDIGTQLFNPFFWFQNVTGILKYTTGLFTIVLCLWALIQNFGKLKFNSILFKIQQKREVFIVGLLIVAYWMFLLLIGQSGFDRRLAAHLPLYMLIVAIALNVVDNKWFTGPFWKWLGLGFAFLLLINQGTIWFEMGLLTYKPVLMFVGLSSIGLIALVRFGTPNIALIYVICINLLSNFMYQSTTHALSHTSFKLSEMQAKYGVKYIVGVNAHQLAANNNIVPIWYQKNQVTWNHQFPIVGKGHATVIVETLNHPKKAIFQESNYTLKNLPERSMIIDSMDIEYQPMIMTDVKTKKSIKANEKLRLYVVKGLD